jgi:hypothetical protein
MALGTPVLGTIAYSATNGTSVSPTHPAGIGAGDVLVLVIGQKPNAANGGTVTTPAGWTLREEKLAAGGYGTSLTADVGNTNLRFYTKNTVSGSESGTLAVTVATSGICWATIILVPADGGSISYGATDGEDPSAGNVSLAGAADPGFAAGDMALWALCIPTDVSTPTQFSAHAITAAGVTFGAATELGEADTATNNDMGGMIAWASVSAGTSSGAPTFTATAGGTTTNVRGPGVVLRIREAAAVSYVYKGALAWSAAYKGLRSDAALYKGAGTLHP